MTKSDDLSGQADLCPPTVHHADGNKNGSVIDRKERMDDAEKQLSSLIEIISLLSN
jgi:hypothetical protein